MNRVEGFRRLSDQDDGGVQQTLKFPALESLTKRMSNLRPTHVFDFAHMPIPLEYT